MLHFCSGPLLWQEDWSTESTIYSIDTCNGEIKSTGTQFSEKIKRDYNCHAADNFLVKMAFCMNRLDNRKTRYIYQHLA